MVSIIPNSVEKIWETWDARGVILLSLSLQLFLIFFAPLRKCSDRIWVVSFIWSAYLLADWAANFCAGLISSNNNGSDNGSVNASKNNLMAFWVPFLLLHFGGTDTITAFALEDNELWLRQIPGLLFQLVASVYVFLLTLPKNPLWIPTLLIFIAGTIKYSERVRALYLARVINAFEEPSVDRDSDPNPDEAKVRKEAGRMIDAGHDIDNEGMNESDELQVVKDAYYYFNLFNAFQNRRVFLFGELTGEYRRKGQYFISRTTVESLRVIEVQLEFMFEMVYTKASVLHDKVGCILRFLTFSSLVVALGLFTSLEKNSSNKFDKIDVRVTYILLYGAVSLETLSLLKLVLSEWIVITSFHKSQKNSFKARFLRLYKVNVVKHFLSLKRPRWSKCKKQPYTKFKALSTPLVLRRWSGSISGLNLIRYCLDQSSNNQYQLSKQMKWLKDALDKVANYVGAKELLKMLRSKAKNPFLLELWQFIFDELKSTRFQVMEPGDWASTLKDYALSRVELNEESINQLTLFKYKTFGEDLILWHVATDVCYADENDAFCGDDKRHFSKLLSDYMLYLLIMQPTMMSEVAGKGQSRLFEDTCTSVSSYIGSHNIKEEKEARRHLLSLSRDYILKSPGLVEKLKQLEDKKWKVVGAVWVHMLAFAATKCTPTSHVQQLSKGGELISLVWLLSFHTGVKDHCQLG